VEKREHRSYARKKSVAIAANPVIRSIDALRWREEELATEAGLVQQEEQMYSGKRSKIGQLCLEIW
jgi:hypothetical protein